MLLVLQGMDTAGKGGIVRHVLGMVDPQGVQLHSFGVPTEKERSQHYLQRIREALPRRRAHRGVRPLALRGRAGGPRQRAGAARGVGAAVRRDQRVRARGRRRRHGDRQGRAAGLARRSRRPGCASGWSARTSTGSSTRGLDERAKWPAYQEAYQAVLDRTSTEHAPWYVVPADSKWYARLAVGALVLATAREPRPGLAAGRLRRRGGEGAAGRAAVLTADGMISGPVAVLAQWFAGLRFTGAVCASGPGDTHPRRSSREG